MAKVLEFKSRWLDQDPTTRVLFDLLDQLGTQLAWSWDLASADYELERNDVFYLLLNVLVKEAAHRQVPIASLDTYFAHMIHHPNSYLNLYRHDIDPESIPPEYHP